MQATMCFWLFKPYRTSPKEHIDGEFEIVDAWNWHMRTTHKTLLQAREEKIGDVTLGNALSLKPTTH